MTSESPRWLSEPYAPGGGGTAEGALKNLDGTELDPLTLLVRESAQNSWDARTGDGPVDYRVDLRTLGPSEAPVWRDLLTAGAPQLRHLKLRASLARPALRILTVTDTGTRGLGGPTRADVAIPGQSDFASFVRKTGSSSKVTGRGGTYGFGKAVFHLLSASHTVVVHTRCRVDDRLETQLIGWAVHESYTVEGDGGAKTFTGRHFWGKVRHGYVEPLVGEEADETAAGLGLTSLPDGETGTSVAILDPVFGERDDAEAIQWIVDAMVWNLWPKMLPEGGGAPMRFSASHEGHPIPVPRPSEVPHLRPFVWAYDDMDRLVEHKSQRRVLGRLGLRKFLSPQGPPPRVAQEAGIGDRLHHTCLMRPVELVVRYLEGPPFFEEGGGYAAVFRADAGMDRVFAAAEPASHDAWLVDKLSGGDRRLAKHALRKINDAMKEASGPAPVSNEAGEGVSLAGMSRLMAGLMAGTAGEGAEAVFTTGTASTGGAAGSGPGFAGTAGVPGPRGGATAPSGRRRVLYDGVPEHEVVGGEAVLVQRFTLPDAGPCVVHGRPAVALGDGRGVEAEPPIGASIPTVLGWRAGDGPLQTGTSLHVEGGDGTVWSLIVRPAPDTMTELTITVQPGEDGR
ncbi:hypothetical protein [Streptomyces somaliensis]|uniref:hypothetical protein n=1 Tax=Streptomyces somaliensis TaxID=78355 RepID=UPI0034E97AF2|nr:hypothetical protein [Streptomyces somaliensis]